MGNEVRIDSAALQKFLTSKDGPVMKQCAIIAQKVKEGAKERVGVSESSAEGHLRDAIVTRFGQDSEGPFIAVGVFGALAERAMYHHDGTAPHPIEGNPLLVFDWPKAGGVVFLRHVDHPGTKANPFLVDAARALGLNVRQR